MITVLGATGHTGNLTVRCLKERNRDIRLAGRDIEKLKRISELYEIEKEPLVCDLDSKESLDALLEGTSVLINCAGPFTRYGMNVVEKCMESSVHHIDITGEQQFIKLLIEKYSAISRQEKTLLVTACAFEYAIADAAAELLEKELHGLEVFESTYIINGMYTSQGTKKSVMESLSSPSYHLLEGELVIINPGKLGSSIEQAACRFPFPGGEVMLTPLHTGVKTVQTYLASSLPPYLVKILSRLTPVVARSFLRPLINKMIEFTSNKVEGHETTSFEILAYGSKYDAAATITVKGFDPYTLTALLAASMAEYLDDSQGVQVEGGVVSAAMVVGADMIRQITEERGVIWTMEKKS